VIAQEGTRPDSVTVIENGVRLSRFAEVAPVSFSSNGLPMSVGMVSNYRPLKGSDVFVKAAKILSESRPSVTFQVAGFGNRDPVSEMAREMGVEGLFTIHDRVDNVPSFLSELDVAVLPSRTEGLSNSLLEYMAAGRPIVAAAVGGTPEVIEDGVHGLLVPAGDAEATARAIDRILRDPSLAARLGAAAKARSWQQNSMETMTRRHEEFYLKLASANAEPSCVAEDRRGLPPPAA
jgi:glycosyltransferase involved in cell wall biosynthesis